MELRPEVRVFAEAMEKRLRDNDHNRGDSWKREGVTAYLFPRLIEEVGELGEQMLRLQHGLVNRYKVRRKAANVANFAMMIADVCGALPKEAKDA